MVKTSLKTSLTTKIILVISLLSVLLFFVTPMFFIAISSGGAVWGFDAILGNTTLGYDFNWYMYIISLVYVVIGVTTFYIGPKARGYYIFAALVFVVLSIFVFNSINLVAGATMHLNPAKLGNCWLGISPWFAGVGAIVSAIACLIDFKTFKLR